jgi:hypothetical protein
MYHSLSDSSHMTNRMTRFAYVAGASLTMTLAFAAQPAAPLLAQRTTAQSRPAAPSRPASGLEIVSQQVSTSRNEASLRLELSDGRTVDAAVRGGHAYLNGKDLGSAPRGAELDQNFRALLDHVTSATSANVPRILKDWQSEPNAGTAGELIDRALDNAVRGIAMPADVDADVAGADIDADPSPALDADGTPASDSVERLNERISELQSMVDNMQDDENSASANINYTRHRGGPFNSFFSGLGHIFSVLIIYAIMFAIAVGVIAFGGRKYIEGVADTARQMTMRSWLVGLAGTFLVVPAFVLGIIALAISIVGIPVLLAWVPLYPLAVVAALALGFLAVAHAAGEALSEKKFYENDYFQRGNSYYFLLTGMGLLLAPFIAAGVMEMAGPWLGFIEGLLVFLGGVTLWVVFTIGFGAVLVSRGGKRPLGKEPVFDDSFAEDLNV